MRGIAHGSKSIAWARVGWSAGASLVVHGVLAVLLRAFTPDASAGPITSSLDAPIPFALAGSPEGSGDEVGHSPVVDRAPPPLPGARTPNDAIDARRDGQNRGWRGAPMVMRLLPYADAVTLQDSPMNAWAQSQAQRIRTSRNLLSWENRRATPNPHDDAFLVSGRVGLRERRRPSPYDAQPGALKARQAEARGSTSTLRDSSIPNAFAHRDGAWRLSSPRATDLGSAQPSPPRGALRARGRRNSVAAKVTHGRPPVDRGPAATPSRTAGRVQDNQNSERLASKPSQSWIDTTQTQSPAPGPAHAGPGRDGVPGPGATERAGGLASPIAPGPGRHGALDTRDERYVKWYLDQRRRVTRGLRFPKIRQLRMDQGTAVYRIRVRRDGRLSGRPSLVRSSGFSDLDAAARSAIVRAAPFSPVPQGLAPGAPTIAVSMSVAFENPMIQ